jgi:MYXO-CTERM domain-containing protein
MKRFVPGSMALALCLGCSGTHDADRIGQGRAGIVNGQVDNGDPAVVYLDMGCSGTLITPKVILTACHCMQQSSPTPDVFFGTDIEGQGDWLSTVDSEIFPGSQCTGDGDFALLTLAESGPAQPVWVNDRDLAPHIGGQIRIAGFGVTSENGQDIGLKRMGQSVLAEVDPGTMYAQADSPSGTCYGDSGGPSFMVFEGTEYVVGATSYGTQECGAGYDASGRTDAHYDWIVQYVADHDPEGLPPDPPGDGGGGAGPASSSSSSGQGGSGVGGFDDPPDNSDDPGPKRDGKTSYDSLAKGCSVSGPAAPASSALFAALVLAGAAFAGRRRGCASVGWGDEGAERRPTAIGSHPRREIPRGARHRRRRYGRRGRGAPSRAG